MLTTIEAEIDVDGNVTLFEPVTLKKTSRAIVTVFDTETGTEAQKASVQNLLEILRKNRFPEV
jgi:hypothetical protein